MWIPILIIMLQILSPTLETQIDLPDTVEEINIQKDEEEPSDIYIQENTRKMNSNHEKGTSISKSNLWKFRQSGNDSGYHEDEKDISLKQKISTLVQQTLHDTDKKIASIKHLKEKNRVKAPYRAGFVLSMIKKARDVLNELFNVAVKHRDQWKALEQLKIFELIVHTNVDTTNLVRQLVEIHLQYMNATSSQTEIFEKRDLLL